MPGIIQKIKTILIPEVGLDLQPGHVVEAEVSTDFTRVFAHLIGKGAASDGRLYVATAGVTYEIYTMKSGDAEATYADVDTFTFDDPQYVTDLLIEDYEAQISFRDHVRNWGDDKIIPVGFASIDFIHYGIKIKNRESLEVCNYEITTYR
ncbi:hypothetical protein ES708_25941 [subsurface metagenome]